MLGGAFMNDKRSLLKNFLLYLFFGLISAAISNISLFNNHFVFVVPWIYFCFLNNKSYGLVAILSSFVYSVVENTWLSLLMVIVILSVIFIKNVLKINNSKMVNVLCVYNFFVVLICGILENVIVKENMFFLCYITGVVSYWVMRYFCDFYFACKKKENKFFDQRVSCFILIILGIILVGSNLSFWWIDFWLVGLLILSYIGVKIGLEVGVIYSLVMFGILLVYRFILL